MILLLVYSYRFYKQLSLLWDSLNSAFDDRNIFFTLYFWQRTHLSSLDNLMQNVFGSFDVFSCGQCIKHLQRYFAKLKLMESRLLSNISLILITDLMQNSFPLFDSSYLMKPRWNKGTFNCSLRSLSC